MGSPNICANGDQLKFLAIHNFSCKVLLSLNSCTFSHFPHFFTLCICIIDLNRCFLCSVTAQFLQLKGAIQKYPWGSFAYLCLSNVFGPGPHKTGLGYVCKRHLPSFPGLPRIHLLDRRKPGPMKSLPLVS